MSNLSYNNDGKWIPVGHSSADWGVNNIGGDSLISGRFYTTGNLSNIVQTFGVANWIRAVPYYNALPTTYDRISVQVLTAQASGLIRLGIYRVEGGVPTALVVDAGDVDASTTGQKDAVIDVTLDSGWHALALNVNNASVAIRGINDSQRKNVAGRSGITGIAGGSVWQSPQTYGAFPDPYVPNSDINHGYMVALRVA